jgi:hypothetical protein
VEIASIGGIPLYDGDVEAESGVPDIVRDLKDRIARADGLLLVTPEYNNSIPGVFKNAIDWLTRPPADIPRVFGNRPVALMGATPGLGGTLLAQTAWLPVLRLSGLDRGLARGFWSARPIVHSTNRDSSYTNRCARSCRASWPVSPSLLVVGDDSSRFLAPEDVEVPRVTQMRPRVRAISSLRIR